MTQLSDARRVIADYLTDSGLNAVHFIKEKPQPPIVGVKFIGLESAANARKSKGTWELEVLIPFGTNEAQQDMLDEFVETIRIVLRSPEAPVTFVNTSEPYASTVGNAEYLAVGITVTGLVDI